MKQYAQQYRQKIIRQPGRQGYHIRQRIQRQQSAWNRAVLALFAVFMLALTTADTVQAAADGGQERMPQPPEYSEDGKQVTFTSLYFGSYPQSEIRDTALTTAITNASYDSYGDAWVGGMKYHRVPVNDTDDQKQSGNLAYRYFKWERIRWRVLGNDGDTLFVMADKGLDCQCYHEVDDEITWENCSLRSWLNGTFFHTAFDSSEREAVAIRQTDHSAYVPGSSTQDYVTIPSMAWMSDKNYGYSMPVGSPAPNRQLAASDYARAMGVRLGDENGGGEQSCWWWMRDPAPAGTASAFNYAALMGNNGAFSLYGRVHGQHRAVVPALFIRRSSDRWYESDDGSSGSGGGEAAAVPLTVTGPDMVRSKNVTAFTAQASGGLTSDYTWQWYYAPSETGNGHPLGLGAYEAIVWQDNALYIDMNAADVPDGLYLYCSVSDGRSRVESGRVWFSRKKTKQTITYNKKQIKNKAVEYGAVFNLNAKTNGKAAKLSYKSSNPKVLSVSGSGKVKAKNYGKAVLTITASDSYLDQYGKTSIKIALTVLPKQVKITKVNRQVNPQGRVESVSVQWQADASVDGFQYSVAYNKKYTNGMNGEKPGKENRITLKYIDVSQSTLYVRVRAYKKTGGKTYYGDWSGSYTVKL